MKIYGKFFLGLVVVLVCSTGLKADFYLQCKDLANKNRKDPIKIKTNETSTITGKELRKMILKKVDQIGCGNWTQIAVIVTGSEGGPVSVDEGSEKGKSYPIENLVKTGVIVYGANTTF